MIKKYLCEYETVLLGAGENIRIIKSILSHLQPAPMIKNNFFQELGAY
jgi:hypothetical protein